MTSKGRTFKEVVFERYSDFFDAETLAKWHSSLNEPITNESEENMLEFQKTFINFPTVRPKSTRIQSMVLAQKEILTLGENNQTNESVLTIVCKHLTELDLSSNLISDWNEIIKMLKLMPNLKWLNLSSNKNLLEFNFNSSESNEFQSSLKTLILNSSFIPLNVIENVLRSHFNQLNEFHLSKNDLTEVNFSEAFVNENIKILHLNDNKLSDWLQVSKLGKFFPNLKYLCLSGNALSDESTSRLESSLFQSLDTLILNKVPINSWTTLDKLRELPKLTTIRIQNIPLLDRYKPEERYFLLVAYLSEKITCLNGSELSPEEKDKCERMYLRHYMESNDERPQRFEQLEQKHGKLDKLAQVDLSINHQVECLIKFNEKCVRQKVSIKQTVGEFKKKLESFAGCKSSAFRLYYVDMEGAFGADELKLMNLNLCILNIKDGDEFIIDLK